MSKKKQKSAKSAPKENQETEELKEKQAQESMDSQNDEKIQELEVKLTRALADYQNLEKQTEKRAENLLFNNMARIMQSLLEIRDDIRMALNSTEGDEISKTGVETVAEKLEKVIEDQEFELIDPEQGDEFDNILMEVITEIESEDAKHKGKVAEVVSLGLKRGEKIIKTSKVILYKKD